MNIIKLNQKSWNKIGARTASPYLNQGNYLVLFNEFCDQLPENAKVLDLGCGPGIPVTTELVFRGFNVTGIDFSKEMIKHAKSNNPTANFKEISMTNINYENEFDGIISSYSMLCLDPKNFEITISKISKALKPNGLFFIALNELKGKLDESKLICKIDKQDIYSRAYSKEEITEFGQKYNLNVLQVKREIYESKMYGKENCLIMILLKT
ncbi:class I SAM-dependent methyltransferase [archaeon]|jgi:2-polyprenyl-3-methyl-5-hydroxy-6-metoxy-1,4-benzoquinol methylase|nr:class I SAM-dependent methyltransferase [archaeon]MBT4021939.1 class I SAM-dependent methyltransferase [archaeon]MBT4272256.1 class I SAM-dependent methyltransferase [archaeon]MBT4460792.1 class I SAM-dependent methyltransferase [archaeon]MBT4858360.1 class I SAM-dependent methyltransferase [archaeon]